jgi:hypothetical protein
VRQSCHRDNDHDNDRHESAVATPICPGDSLRFTRSWRGLATNLHQLSVSDQYIESILRQCNIGIKMNIHVKNVAELPVDAMDLLRAEMEKKNFGSFPSDESPFMN